MGKLSGVSWCDASWGPWRGCRPVTSGCDKCFAKRDQTRYGRDHSVVVRAKPKTFNAPLAWEREAVSMGDRRRVFVCPWSDFWIEEADGQWREDALAIVRQCPHLDFIVPTKRIERANWHGQAAPANWWQLVSVSTQEDADRMIPLLLQFESPIRGVSYEPALGPVDFTPWVGYLDWIIAGCESASHTTPGRPAELDWFRRVRDACTNAGVYYFLKQVAVDGRLVHEPRLDGLQWLGAPYHWPPKLTW